MSKQPISVLVAITGKQMNVVASGKRGPVIVHCNGEVFQIPESRLLKMLKEFSDGKMPEMRKPTTTPTPKRAVRRRGTPVH